MHVTMDRQTLVSLPSAHRPHAAIEIGGNLLPRLETVPDASRKGPPSRGGQRGPEWATDALAIHDACSVLPGAA